MIIQYCLFDREELGNATQSSKEQEEPH